MKYIWAPWRMEYIKQVGNAGECFLCATVADSSNDRENLVLERGKVCLCILNRFPYNCGHILVSPNKHKSALDELTDEEFVEIHRLTDRALRALHKAFKPHGYNIGLNLGRSAGAGLPGHIHWHVVPRWDGDTNFMPVLADVKVIPQALVETRDQLVKMFGEL